MKTFPVLKELSEDGRTRLVRRFSALTWRSCTQEAISVAQRMWQHAQAVERDRYWLRRDLASQKSYSENLDTECQRLRERCSKLYVALKKIRDNEGKVCDMYEICSHRACRSSYNAWAVADEAAQ